MPATNVRTSRSRDAIYRPYLRSTDRINNWDLVDISTPMVVGAHLMERSRAPLHRLAKSGTLWERRIAIVSSQYLIARGHFADTLRLADVLLDDEEDLIHKAVGWMLRYSLERLSPARRKHYMAMPRRPRIDA